MRLAWLYVGIKTDVGMYYDVTTNFGLLHVLLTKIIIHIESYYSGNLISAIYLASIRVLSLYLWPVWDRPVC